MASDTVVIRQATLSDYLAVLDINTNVYSGNDYLVFKYHQFLEDPHYLAYVAELNGKVVGFSCAEITNDGSCYLGMAGRVHPEYQNRGISKKLYQEMTELLLKKFPSVKFRTSTAIIGEQRKKYIAKGLSHLTLKWGFVCHDVSKAALRKGLQSLGTKLHATAVPKVLSLTDAITALSNPGTKTSLFGDWFVYDNYWCPLQVTDANLRTAAQKSNVMATFSSDQQSSAISFDSFVKARGGSLLTLWFYGRDPELLFNHLYQALARYVQVTSDCPCCELKLVLCYPKAFERKLVAEKLKPILGVPNVQPPLQDEQAGAFCSKL